MLIERLERVVEVFGLGKVQDVLTFLDYLQKEGVSVQDVRDYMAECAMDHARARMTTRAKRLREWEQKAPKCPECGMPLRLREITLSPGRGNENAYRSEWYCPGAQCIYEAYSTMPALEQIKKYGLNGGRDLVARCNQEK